MAKGIWVGVGGSRRQVKKLFVGIGGVARKVKKGFIGIGGQVRLFFSGIGEIKKYRGKIEDLGNFGSNVGVYDLMGINAGVYAVFEGGSMSYSNVAEGGTAFDNNLVKNSIYNPGNSRRESAYCNLGTKGVIFPGRGNGSLMIDTYMRNENLTSTTVRSDLLSRFHGAAASLDEFALGGGGYTGSSGSEVSGVSSVSPNGVIGTAPNLSHPRYRLTATRIGDKIVFGGGYIRGSSAKGILDVYDKNKVHNTVTTNVVMEHEGIKSNGIGRHGVFVAVGYSRNELLIVDDNLVHNTIPSIVGAAVGTITNRNGNYMMFIGGGGHAGPEPEHGLIIDSNLASDTIEISKGNNNNNRINGAGASTKDYMLFAGGTYLGYGGEATKIVEGYYED